MKTILKQWFVAGLLVCNACRSGVNERSSNNDDTSSRDAGSSGAPNDTTVPDTPAVGGAGPDDAEKPLVTPGSAGAASQPGNRVTTLLPGFPGTDCNGGPPNLRLLTNREYKRSLQVVFGLVPQGLHSAMFDGYHGFPFPEASMLNLDLELLSVNAGRIADQVAENLDALDLCPADSAAACVDAFIRGLARAAYRRPLTDVEAEGVSLVYSFGLAAGDHASGIHAVVRLLTLSPFFLYEIDWTSEGTDRTSQGAESAPLSAYQQASALSLAFLGQSPTSELLQRARSGELSTHAGYDAVLSELFERPEADEMLGEMHRYWLGLENGLGNDRVSPELERDLLEEDQRFASSLFRHSAPFAELLLSPRAELNGNLARHYGYAGLGEIESWTATEHRSERVGIFAHASVLSAYPSVTERGLLALNRLSCSSVPPHPAGIDAQEVPEPSADHSTRQQQLAATEPEALCSMCHQLINGPGFLFLPFDALGGYRETDAFGRNYDTSGQLNGTPVTNLAELMHYSAQDHRAHECYVAHWATYLLRRPTEPTDFCMVRMGVEALQSGGLRAMLMALMSSGTFNSRRRLASTPRGIADSTPELGPPDETVDLRTVDLVLLKVLGAQARAIEQILTPEEQAEFHVYENELRELERAWMDH